ncbi:MAG: hypothetical protein AAF639_15555, partial [Chloroflexota bacterium]
ANTQVQQILSSEKDVARIVKGSAVSSSLLSSDEFEEETLEVIQSVHRFLLYEHKQTVREALSSWKSKLQSVEEGVNKLEDNIIKIRYLSDAQLIYQESIDELDIMMDHYIDSMNIYKAGVIAYKAKATIEQLGLGRLTDEAEKIKFEDFQLDHWRNEIHTGVFPEFLPFDVSKEFSETFYHEQEEILNEVQSLNADLERLEYGSTKRQLPTPASAISAKSSLVHRYITDISHTINECSREIDKERRTTTREISVYSLNQAAMATGFTFLTLIVLTILTNLSLEFFPNTVNAWLLTVLICLTTSCMTVGLARFFAIRNRVLSSTHSSRVKKYRNEITQPALHRLFSSMEDYRKNEAFQITRELHKEIEQHFDNSKLGRLHRQINSKVIRLEKRYADLINQYSEEIHQPIEHAIKCLENTDENLLILEDVSSDIQASAIRPILKKFEDYGNGLRSAKESVEKIHDEF